MPSFAAVLWKGAVSRPQRNSPEMPENVAGSPSLSTRKSENKTNESHLSKAS